MIYKTRLLPSRLSAVILFGIGLAVVKMSSVDAAETHPSRRLLFYNRSAGFQHTVVQVKNGRPCYAEKMLDALCKENKWELVSTKDGGIFTPKNINSFDAFLFYTTGDL